MRRGQTLVEFAASLAILVLLLLGLAELGRYVFTLSTLTHAVREGARYAIMHPTDDDGIIQRVRQGAVSLDPSLLNVPAPTFNPSTRSSGSLATVTASYQFQSVMGMFSRTVTASATMRVP